MINAHINMQQYKYMPWGTGGGNYETTAVNDTFYNRTVANYRVNKGHTLTASYSAWRRYILYCSKT